MTGLEKGGASGSGRELRADDRRLNRALASVPFLLLVLSLVFTVAAGGSPLETGPGLSR